MEDNKEMELDKKNESNNEAKETADNKPFHYKHARANIAVDVVVFGVLPDKDELHVFVQRDTDKDNWSLPGRFMHCGANPDDEIALDDNWDLEKTRDEALHMTWPIITTLHGEVLKDSESYTIKQNDDFICQLEVMSKIHRDSRPIRVVSVPYVMLVYIPKEDMPSDLINNYVAQWMPLSELIRKGNLPGKVKLDHDHFDILINGLKRLYMEVRTRPIGMGMLPTVFELSSLLHIYSVITRALGMDIKLKSNLKKLLDSRGVIQEVMVNNGNSSGKVGTKYAFVVAKYIEYKTYLNFGFTQNQRKSTEDGENKKE